MRAARRWLSVRPIELVFAALLTASVAYWLRITSSSWFYADEWSMAWQVRRAANILNPYNGHLSLVILGVYRVLLEVFGFSTYTPYRLAGAISLAAVSLAMFVHARFLLGPGPAAVMALVLLWLPRLSIEPGGLNHSLGLVGGIVCAHGLSGRSGRRDLVVAGGLAIALASAGGGVAVIVAAVVHNLCTRSSRSRWLAVVAPSVLWLAWWRLEVPPDAGVLSSDRPDELHLVWGALGHASESFASLALGDRRAGLVLLAAFLCLAVWRLRHGLDASANVLAWSAALCFWWYGIMRSRWLFLDGPPIFRYELVSVGFIMLAVLPRRPASWAGVLVDNRRKTTAATVAVVGLAAALVFSGRPDLQMFAREQALIGQANRIRVALIAVGPHVIPDETAYPVGLGYLDAGQVRDALSAYPSPTFLEDADQLLLQAAGTRLQPGPEEPQPPACSSSSGIRSVAPMERLVVHAMSGTTKVEVRRLGERWVPIGRLATGRSAAVVLPQLGFDGDWFIRAQGICFVAGAP